MAVIKRIKKDDIIKVINGKDSGKTGKVLEIDRKDGRVMVEGVNMVKKTMRKSKKNQVGGIKDVEAFLDISNVMVVCPKCKKTTRVGFKITDDKKNRICKKCEAEID
jgi:large subunit ribosomal protein L24